MALTNPLLATQGAAQFHFGNLASKSTERIRSADRGSWMVGQYVSSAILFEIHNVAVAKA